MTDLAQYGGLLREELKVKEEFSSKTSPKHGQLWTNPDSTCSVAGLFFNKTMGVAGRGISRRLDTGLLWFLPTRDLQTTRSLSDPFNDCPHFTDKNTGMS